MLEAEPEGRERPGSRAIFLHRESLEHLESICEGLGWQLAHNGIVWTTKKTYYGEDLVYERTYPPPDTTRLPHSTNLSQVAIERVLLDACVAAGVTFAWEQQLESSTSSSDGVVLRTTSGDEWRCSYVVGADGARSVVRSSAGIDLVGPRVEDAFVIVDVAEDDERPMLPERVYYYEHPAVGGRNVLLVPFAGGIRADLQLRRDDDPERFNDRDSVKVWIGRVLPVAYADRVTWVSTYRFHQAVASAFTDEHRRVCLVGEAAHLFAPFGARGLNSGVPDALVAARSIKTALDGDARAIDHFAATRREAAIYNRDASNLALQHMQANGWAVRAKRRLRAAIREARHCCRSVARLVTVRSAGRRAQDRDRLLLIASRHAIDSVCDCVDHRRGMVDMRGVCIARQDEPLHRPAHAGLDRFELRRRAVRVVEALDQQHRAGDRWQVRGDVPRAELGRQPHVVPAAERAVDVVVVSGEPRSQIAAFVCEPCRFDAGDRPFLHEDVGRQEHERGHREAGARGDDRDRRTVAVADEHGSLDAVLGEDRFQDLRFVVHVGDRARTGNRRCVAVARSRVHEGRRTDGIADV